MKLVQLTVITVALLTILRPSSQLQAETGFSKRPKVGILETSTILQSRGKIALVPKGSILFLPKHLESKIATSTAKGEIVSWKTFLAGNGSWIHMFPVTFDQAIGKKKITQEQLKSLRRLNKIVIARRGSNLVSVSPKALEPEETKAKSSK